MGRCFVISVGGTGSRVMRALTHLKAAGVFRDNERPENDIHIMTVDSDGANAESTVRLIERYIELSDCFSVEEMSQQSWTPLDRQGTLTDILCPRDGRKEFENGSDGEKLYKFLYSPKERGVEKCILRDDERQVLKLEGGFYSHTSIGSYFMTKDIHQPNDGADNFTFTNDGWRSYFLDVNTAEDKVIIICSMFGGTGASGVAPLAKAIREVYPDMQIAGVFLEPYFKTTRNGAVEVNDIVNSSDFGVKCKIAMDYYSEQKFCGDTRNPETVFTQMYFLGEDLDNLDQVPHVIDGRDQKNPPNMIEIYASLAVIDYMTRKHPRRNEVTDTEVFIGLRRLDREGRERVSPQFMNAKYGIYNHLADFLFFSIFYTRFMYEPIRDNRDVVEKANKWLLDSYNLDTELNETMNEYCNDFIRWIEETVRRNRQTRGWFLRAVERIPADGANPLLKCRAFDEVAVPKEGRGLAGHETYVNSRGEKWKTRSIRMEYIYQKLSNQKKPKSKKPYSSLIQDIMSIIQHGEI